MINGELIKMLFKYYADRYMHTIDFFNLNFNTQLKELSYNQACPNDILRASSIFDKILIRDEDKQLVSFYDLVNVCDITDEMIMKFLLERI